MMESERYASLRNLSNIANRIQNDLNQFKEILDIELGFYSGQPGQSGSGPGKNYEGHSANNAVNLIGIEGESQVDAVAADSERDKMDIENVDSIKGQGENFDQKTITKSKVVQSTGGQSSSKFLRSNLKLRAKGQNTTITTRTTRTTSMIMKPKKKISDIKPFRQMTTRNAHDNTHMTRSKKLIKVVENGKKLTKKNTNVKRPAKKKRSIDIDSLNDSIVVNNAVKVETRNSSKEKLAKKLSNDDMESGSGNASISSQISDFVLELESENLNESSIEENIGDIDMDMDMDCELKSEGENVLMNCGEEKNEQREDELKYFEDLKNYNWGKDGDGIKINNSIHCLALACTKKYRSKRDFYNHMLAAHWNIFQFKCDYCEKFYSQIQTRRTHEDKHTKAEKKLVSKPNLFKKRKVSENDNDHVDVNIEEISLSLNNLGTSLQLRSSVVNMIVSEESLNQEETTKDENDKSNDSKKNGGSESETRISTTKNKRKYNVMKNVEKCYVVCFADDEKKSKMHQCKKCFEILRDVSITELLDHVHSHTQEDQ